MRISVVVKRHLPMALYTLISCGSIYLNIECTRHRFGDGGTNVRVSVAAFQMPHREGTMSQNN